MCTTSIVRFRFSLKDNLTNSQTLNLNNKSIESESKYLSNFESNIRSIRSTIGVKSNNKLITETLNMNKGLSNGHQLNDNTIDSNLNNNSDIDLISTTSCSSITTTTSSSYSSTSTVSSCEATMGLSNPSTKESLTQHLLLTTLKSGKPENGQRIDLTNISWTDLKQNNYNKSNDLIQNQTNSEINEHHLETNCLPQNSPLNDQTVDQMIEEVLNKSESQVSEELTAEPMLETNTSEDQQQNELSSAPEVSDHSNKNNMCDGSSVASEERTRLAPSQPIDVNEQQLSLMRQTERLMRRLRRLQFTQNHKHFSKQMKAFVENQQKVLGVGCQRQTEPITSSVPQLQSYSNPVEDRMKLLTPEGVKGLSTSALVNLVKRLGSTTSPNEANHLHDFYPQQTPVRAHTQTPPFTSSPHSFIPSPQVTQIPSTPTPQLPNCGEESSLVKLLEKTHSQSLSAPQQSRVSLEEKEAIVSTLDSLTANLRHFETGFDSDATESSSGGESCDEFEDYNHESVPQHSTPIQNSGHTFPIRKRSCWKWCVERAAIASRWTWLQAQVADLEFRIRQQNEMYRQLRATKGLISFGTADHSLTVPTPNVSKGNALNMAMTTTSVSNSFLHSTQTTVPSSEGLPPIGAQPPQTSSSESESHNCMRTLPLNSMRKRKLVRSMSALSGATRKAAKYSTVQCSCNGLPEIVWPCVLCNGRYSYVHVIDTDCMPLFERVALLDSSCHSVLSLNNDVSLGLHCTELLKRETIQRPIPSRHLNKKRKSPPSPTLTNKFIFDSTKNKSPKRSQSVISSTKLKKKYDGSSKRRYVRRSGVSGDNVWRKRGRPRERISSGSSRTESPIPSPVPSEGSSCGNSLSAPLHRRRRSEQHAFDINNIVIPYSIAATTRVEKLQYKEIITPKWRVIDSFEDKFNFSQISIKSEVKTEPKPVLSPKESTFCDEDEDEEDVSEVVFAIRHAKCEEEERKRILAFMKGNTNTGSMRGRGARVRFDSTRSDTNASTADGVFQNTDSTSQDSLYTGPSTPIAPNTNDLNIAETPPPITERRRNASLSSRRDDSIDENFETVPPFDLRTFPLNDLEYELLSKDTQISSPIDTLESINDPEKSNEGTITANNSRAPTPIDSDGAESVVEPTEEVDNDEDPEWEPKKL